MIGTETTEAERGIAQIFVLSPLIFNVYLEAAIESQFLIN